MPISFRFNNDQGPVTLAQVDDWICQKKGIKPDPNQYSLSYMIYTDNLLCLLLQFGGCEILCSHLMAITEEQAAHYDDPIFYELIETFDFTAWR